MKNAFYLILFLLIPLSVMKGYAQNREIKGVVTDDKGETLIGASVVASYNGNNVGTITDIDGNFTLNADLRGELVVSYIGYNDYRISINNKTFFEITLLEASEKLDEVVVVGYGVQKKALVTGATVQVKGDKLQRLSTNSPISAMQSMSPGVTITQQSGKPNQGYKVTIRGLGTIGNSNPLYVIDGIVGGDLNQVNPSDIESIDVLKDAASAAIYGAKAANGVVLVTTKRGKAGAPVITFDGYYGIQNPQKLLKTLDANGYMNIINEARMMNNQPAFDFEGRLDPEIWKSIKDGSFKGTNWIDEFRNVNAPTQNYALNIAGGNEYSVYSLGFSFNDQKSMFGIQELAKQKWHRYTFRLNSDHVLKKINKLDVIKLGETIYYRFNDELNGGMNVDGGRYENNIRSLIVTNPLFPAFVEPTKENPLGFGQNPSFDEDYPNPLAAYYYVNTNSMSQSHNLRSSVYLEIQPIKDLKIKSTFGYNFWSGSSRSFSPIYKLNDKRYNDIESISNSVWTGFDLSWENTINYKFTLSDNNVDVLVGQSLQKSGFGLSLSGSNVEPLFNDFKYAFLSNAIGFVAGKTKMSGDPYGQYRMASFFGRINYDFKNKYMASIIMRSDGSSNFAKGNRWGYFPSFSAGWVVTEENFMDSFKSWLDFFKLRASWGQNGNESIDAFQYLATINMTAKDAYYSFGTDPSKFVPGSYPDILPNKDIKWETSEQTNIGFDARLLDSRLGIAFDWYKKVTKDWLVRAPQLATYGTGAPYINGGDVENTGFELGLTWNHNISDFKYSVIANYAYNKNEVTRLANNKGYISGGENLLMQGQQGELYRAQVGQPIGFFYGYKTAGVWQTQEQIDEARANGQVVQENAKPGDLIWVNTDGNDVIDEYDRVNLGSPHPHSVIGLTLTAEWKGLDFMTSMNGTIGNKVARSLRSWPDEPMNNYTTDIYERWHGEGTSNRLPSLASGENWSRVSDIYIYDASFLRIQNITLGYDFKKLFTKLPVSQLRLYLTAQNLWTFTKYPGMDPEIGFGNSWGNDSWMKGVDIGFYPQPRTYLLGVNIKW